jgi:short-subunit dehydrogenase
MDVQSAHPPLALVTGGSSGIGRALAGQLVERGFDVVIAAEDDGVHQAAQELGEHGCDVGAVQVDLATADGPERLHQEVAGTGRPLAAAALNAGVAVGGEFAHTSLDDDLRLVDLNCRSTVHLAKLVIRDMVAAGQGRLLFTSSIAAAAPSPYQATYGASKAFVHSFAEALRHELRGTGVTVTSLMPGPTDTAIFERGGLQSTAIATGHKDDPADVARDAVGAMLDGRAVVVTGPVTNRVQVAAAGLLPSEMAATLVARQTRPGSGTRTDPEQGRQES